MNRCGVTVAIVIIFAIVIISMIRMNDRDARNPNRNNEMNDQVSTKNMQQGTLQLRSSAWSDGEIIPNKYTCKGGDVMPPLEISGLPDGTKTLAIIMHDPDAPSGDFLHFTIWNISRDTKEIAEATTPIGAVEGKNDFGKIGYGGPCPHAGTHHYVFDLYALDDELDVPDGASREDIEAAMNGHILEKTTLTGTVSAE